MTGRGLDRTPSKKEYRKNKAPVVVVAAGGTIRAPIPPASIPTARRVGFVGGDGWRSSVSDPGGRAWWAMYSGVHANGDFWPKLAGRRGRLNDRFRSFG